MLGFLSKPENIQLPKLKEMMATVLQKAPYCVAYSTSPEYLSEAEKDI